jgi:hypothetical protein
MKLIKTIACTAALLFSPALATAAPAPTQDQPAAGQTQSKQDQATKPQVTCPMAQGTQGGMMQGTQGGMMNGGTMPYGQGHYQHHMGRNGTGVNGMNCVHNGTVAPPTPAPSPQAPARP